MGKEKHACGRYRQGLVVGKFAPFHCGHKHLVATAEAACDALLVLCYSNPDFPDMPSDMRANWIRSLFPYIQVCVPRDPPPDTAEDLTHRSFVCAWLTANGIVVDVVFSSEDYGPGFAAVIGASHVMVDRHRSEFPISGRMIRQQPLRHSHGLDAIVRKDWPPLALL